MPDFQRQLRFVETLGLGGFGVVYLADVERSDGFQQRLAVKILSAELTQNDDIAARQRDEARLLAQLNHHAIVKVFDLITIEGRPAVLMEYVDGVDAAVLSSDGSLSPRAALQLLAAAADALHVAYTTTSHQTGRPLAVVHRDIKPANLLVSRHGGVKVLDFGIARAEFDREGITGSMQYGSARYMAPEQWLHGVADHPVDIYALGVSAVELLAGTAGRRAPLVDGHFERHISETLAALPEDLPLRQPIAAILREMMRFCPEERPGAVEVSERLLALSDQISGEGLSRYARRHIPRLIEARRSRYEAQPLPGEVRLFEEGAQRAATPRSVQGGGTSSTIDHPRPTREQPPRWVLPASVVLGAAMFVGLAGIGLRLQPPQHRTAAAPVVEEPSPGGRAPPAHRSPATTDTAVSARPELAEPSPAAVVPAPARAPASIMPASEAQTEPVGVQTPGALAMAQAEASPVPVVETRQVTFGSQKGLDTQVFLDGQLLGTTPLTQPIPLGVHSLKMVHSSERIEETITVGLSTASNYTWKLPVDRIHGSD